MSGTASHWAYSTGPLGKQRELQKLIGACALDRQSNCQYFLRYVEYKSHRKMCYDGRHGDTI